MAEVIKNITYDNVLQELTLVHQDDSTTIIPLKDKHLSSVDWDYNEHLFFKYNDGTYKEINLYNTFNYLLYDKNYIDKIFGGIENLTKWETF